MTLHIQSGATNKNYIQEVPTSIHLKGYWLYHQVSMFGRKLTPFLKFKIKSNALSITVGMVHMILDTSNPKCQMETPLYWVHSNLLPLYTKLYQDYIPTNHCNPYITIRV